MIARYGLDRARRTAARSTGASSQQWCTARCERTCTVSNHSESAFVMIDLPDVPIMPTGARAVLAAGGHTDSWPWPVLVVLGIVVVLAVVVLVAHLTHHEQRARGLAARHRRDGEDATARTVADDSSPSVGADDVENRSPSAPADNVTPPHRQSEERDQPPS